MSFFFFFDGFYAICLTAVLGIVIDDAAMLPLMPPPLDAAFATLSLLSMLLYYAIADAYADIAAAISMPRHAGFHVVLRLLACHNTSHEHTMLIYMLITNSTTHIGRYIVNNNRDTIHGTTSLISDVVE